MRNRKIEKDGMSGNEEKINLPMQSVTNWFSHIIINIYIFIYGIIIQ